MLSVTTPLSEHNWRSSQLQSGLINIICKYGSISMTELWYSVSILLKMPATATFCDGFVDFPYSDFVNS